MELSELQKQTKEKMEAHEALKGERDQWVRERVTKVNQEAEAIYGERLTKLSKESFDLQAQLHDALNERSVKDAEKDSVAPRRPSSLRGAFCGLALRCNTMDSGSQPILGGRS